MLNPDDFKRSIQSIDALGATPAVLVKVSKLAADPNTDIETISAVLRNDGPLAADIIRISNSPYYAPPNFHSNITSAIHYIGLREVTRVVNLSLARQLFARDLTSYGVSAADYWSASVASALVMEALALAKPIGLNPEDAYTLGIIHAIGRVLINRVIEENGFSIFWDGQQSIEEWERGIVGFDFAEAGAMLLEHWDFPPTTCEFVRQQLQSRVPASPVSPLDALQFTRRLLALTGFDFKNETWLHPETDPFVQVSGLTAESVTQIISACRDDFQTILQSVDLM